MISVLIITWINKEKLELGERKIWIPLAILAFSPTLTFFTDPNYRALSGAFLGGCLFGFYLLSKRYGSRILNIFAPFVIIEAISVVIQGTIFQPGQNIGGLISPTNWDAATGFMVFGTLVYSGKHKWILVTIAAIGLYFTGAPEAIVAIGVFALTFSIRKDFGKKLAISLSIIFTVVLLWSAFGSGIELYERVWDKTSAATSGDMEEWNSGWDNKLHDYKRAIIDITPFGHGYEIYHYKSFTGIHTIHNVPLVILDQVGIFAFLSWIWVTGYCLIKTEWKYAWIGFLSVCAFDHYCWTTFAPYWWLLVGVTLVHPIKNDMIFKEEESVQAA